MSLLARVTLVLIALAIGHDIDHLFNQPSRDYAWEITVSAILIYFVLGGTLYLALRRDPFAPLASVVTGLTIAAGFAAVHLLPHWSVLSDPYSRFSPNALSWFFVIAPIAAGLALAWLGARELAARPRVARTA